MIKISTVIIISTRCGASGDEKKLDEAAAGEPTARAQEARRGGGAMVKEER